MKWLYHKEQGAKLFKADENPEGWFDSPAKFAEPEKQKFPAFEEFAAEIEKAGEEKPVEKKVKNTKNISKKG